MVFVARVESIMKGVVEGSCELFEMQSVVVKVGLALIARRGWLSERSSCPGTSKVEWGLSVWKDAKCEFECCMDEKLVGTVVLYVGAARWWGKRGEMRGGAWKGVFESLAFGLVVDL